MRKALTTLTNVAPLLIHTLRERLRLTAIHIGCDTTHCGACTADLALPTHNLQSLMAIGDALAYG